MRLKDAVFGLAIAFSGVMALMPHLASARGGNDESIHPYRDVAVAWHTDLPSDSIVFFSMLPLHADNANISGYQHVETLATSTDHVVHLQGLISDTTYYYMVVSRTPEGIPIYIARSRFTLP